MIKKYKRFFMRRICTARFSNCCNSRVCTNNYELLRKYCFIIIWIASCAVLYLVCFELRVERKIELDFLKNSRNLTDYIPNDRRSTIISVATPVICQLHTDDVKIIYFITSAPENRANRLAIRRTWGSTLNPKPIFFTGTTSDHVNMELLLNEARIYQDIVIEDFVDHYNNLTIKVGFMLKHFQSICPTAKYLMKTDDDMFIYTNVIEQIIGKVTDPQALIGRRIMPYKPIRYKQSKWYVPLWLYENEVYPEYLSGTGYILPNSVIKDVTTWAFRTPIIHIEDVFYTGIIGSELLSLPLKHDRRFSEESPLLNNYCFNRHSATLHRITPEGFYKLWVTKDENCDLIDSFRNILYKFRIINL